MKPYIFTERNNIYIIDLQKTVELTEKAYRFVKEIAQEGKTLLFVGTKKQAQEAIQQEALRCGMFYVNQRWLGGMLTNFSTIRNSIERLKRIEAMEARGLLARLPKKEVMQIMKRKAQLTKYLSGIRDMERLPDCLFVVDPRRERNAVLEARKLSIPIVGIVDTNCDPDEVDYVIPGNDDAIRAIRLFASIIADAVIEGKRLAQEGMEMMATETVSPETLELPETQEPSGLEEEALQVLQDLQNEEFEEIGEEEEK